MWQSGDGGHIIIIKFGARVRVESFGPPTVLSPKDVDRIVTLYEHELRCHQGCVIVCSAYILGRIVDQRRATRRGGGVTGGGVGGGHH